MTDTQSQMVPVRAGFWRAAPLALCWLCVAWPIVLFLTARVEPELAVRMAQIAKASAVWLGIGSGVLLAVVLVAFPPARAGLRLLAERFRLHFASDRSALLKALSELEHFESSARHLEVGRMALGRADLNLAAKHLTRAVELDPRTAGARYQFGLLLIRVGQLEMARTAFETAEKLDPGHAFGNAMLEAGRCAVRLGDAAGAVRLLEEHQRVHGGGRKSHYWLGLARAAAGDRDGAVAALRVAAEPVTQRLTAEENWFRALAKVRLWRGGGA